ncbi:hypothetical protein DND132_0971 [Pseudodesulfovibrio mercurii]|uniref:Type I phosphodiesterase/nucleotide pyrophosphatase n=1 Tax=Pseudodesulfovibrio mercurii TaxID=641491 RepID=F0JID2_9BACT|nr:alkaline phosphatase family protein [Pseudodesulfovibrio mercurii]EGB14184.1 hypothetical protein DND132_0971 [Pseudodesulfovibrio mercurii]
MNPVYILGLDAYDHVLMKQWAAEGALPHLAELLDSGPYWDLHGSTEVLQGSIWPGFATSADPGRHGMYFVYQMKPGSYSLAKMRADDMRAEPFWNAACAAGLETVVLDVPKVALGAHPRLVQVVEYGAMDHYSRYASHPRALAGRLRATHGEHVLLKPFRQPVTDDQSRDLLAGLLRGVRQKNALGMELIEEHDPRLFISVFGEAHAAGHHFWALMDGQAGQSGDPALRRALKEIYVALDQAVGDFIKRYASRANILLVSGHGMDRDERSHWVMDDVLIHLGLLSMPGRPDPAREPRGNARRPVRGGLLKRLDLGLRRLVKEYAPAAVTDRIHLMLQQRKGVDHARSIAWSLPSDHQGCIRLNVRGREPQGIIDPVDYAGTVDNIVEQIGRLVNADTGNPIAERIFKIQETYAGGAHLDVLPDISVLWRNEPINRVRHPQRGEFAVSRAPWGVRCGNHRLEGFCLATGPDIRNGGHAGEADLQDIGASALSLLGVPVPDALESVPLPHLLAED